MDVIIRAVAAASRFRSAAGGRSDWLLPAGVAAYVVVCTWGQPVPIPGRPVFAAAFAVLVALAVAVYRIRGIPASPTLFVMTFVCIASVLTDVIYAEHIHFPDLGIYLQAGRHLIHGQPVYTQVALTELPRDPTTLPFLYPPPTLLLFGTLAALPGGAAGILFVAMSVGAVLLAARRLGLRPPWSLAIVAWPPVLDGLVSGNVAVPLFAAFVLAPWVGSGLVVAPLFKPYNAIAALWLVRERRFRALATGIAVVIGLSVVALPFTGGFEAWISWLGAIGALTRSEANIPALYGVALARYLPFALVPLIGAPVVLAALRARWTDGLGRLGIATITAQSSIYPHGFIVALPALLTLRAAWFWVAMAALSITISTGPSLGPTLGWPGTWIPVVVVLVSWAVPGLRREAASVGEPWHPVGRTAFPWPDASGGGQLDDPLVAVRGASRAGGPKGPGGGKDDGGPHSSWVRDDPQADPEQHLVQPE
jgi:hypothetical protein